MQSEAEAIEAKSIKINIQDTFNIEEVFLIPAIDYTNAYGPYVMRRAYYIGHGLQTNRVYDFVGYTLPDPATQAATHILTSANPAETDIDTFKLKDTEYGELKTLFQVKVSEGSPGIQAKFNDIADQLAEHVTHIFGRRDLHNAVDLVYHSPLQFDFDNVRVRKGWLECLILGDTRTGKGFVAEGLCNYYGVGEVVSGENVSLAGLVGSVQHIGDRWALVWGKIPLADRRLIVIDESGALDHHEISRLSRIRSEGVAEITKVISEKTTSRTRLIWLANPRPANVGPRPALSSNVGNGKRMISDYNYGIESVPELIGAAEDVSRFDYALVLAHNEVSTKVINTRHRPTGNMLYPSTACRNLIMWVWGRTAEQIKFTAGVPELIMHAAQTLSGQLSAKIGLVQGEDVRFKLARIATAAAARTFSTVDGITLRITKAHVEFAYNFLFNIYNKQCAGYVQMSQIEHERITMRDIDAVKRALDLSGDAISDLIDGLLEHRQISTHDMCDYTGLDLYAVRTIISELVRRRALDKEYTWYVKRPAFSLYLRQLKSRMTVDEHVTEPDNIADKNGADKN
jgi:hypothetical protein